MPALTTLTSTATVEDVCKVLDRDGGVIIEDYADRATIRGLWDDLGPDLEAQAWGEGGFVGDRTRRVSSLFRRSRHSATLVTRPHFREAARHFLQRPVHTWVGDERVAVTPSVQVGLSQAIQIWPGQGGQPLHRDDGLHLRSHPGPQSRVQIMFALSEFTARNGGTRVIPGSHLWDDDRMPTPEEAVATEMPQGAALIWLGSTYHAGGRNTADEPRTGLSYALDIGNVRQEENQYLAVPRDVVRTYPEEIQRLLGWEVSPPFCGWYEMNDPMVLLATHSADAAALTSHDMFSRQG